ncbi:hypothetical protein [Mycolicibacterium mucogenicum]|uniref:Uncharacterized protein n=1 Tax=Mycolicibacterium mucogenicum DSM 44124 TaxID=1226753 RepID=A0A8H2JIU8_MYCMU|nr:hypothetical protein [Mycolicibacterium mucogenicum]KAB7753684.1 hypothetical protein MMUC44124_24175 [Mycolicibacterium mucogenicum DSM 44124]QPG68909.1 hypothetical protein C1S78_026415 [Mycolicibacterium mucogenicum DSM 44124]
MSTDDEYRAFRMLQVSTRKHEMTVLRDEGTYRHIRFKEPGTSIWWFDLVTWPGHLVITGDLQDFHFSRLDDMFEFFRKPPGYINASYWSEKLCGPQRFESFSPDSLKRQVYKHFRDWCRDNEGPHYPLWRAIRDEVLDYLDECDETLAHQRLHRFQFGRFNFGDSWEWNLRDYDWHFLVSLHAIVWGIKQYDKSKPVKVLQHHERTS